MKRTIKVILVGLAMAAAMDTATAAPKAKDAPASIAVPYGDLNLQSEAGATTLLGRISRAARTVCEIPAPGASNIHAKNQRFACRRVAVQNAVESLDHPVVNSVYEGKRTSPLKLAAR